MYTPLKHLTSDWILSEWLGCLLNSKASIVKIRERFAESFPERLLFFEAAKSSPLRSHASSSRDTAK